MTFRAQAFLSILGATLLVGGLPAQADKIKHPTVVFAGLDKITGRIITFDVAIDETVQFGTLQITPRVCYTRPPTEAPQTTSFVEVEDVTTVNETKRIFSGWMFAASPGLHAVEHPVYDIWLNDCRGGKDIIVTPPETANLREEAPSAPPAQVPPQTRPRQQARPVSPGGSPGGSPQTGAVPAFGQMIDVGAAPGLRPTTQPNPQVFDSSAPRTAPPAARQPPPRDPTGGLLPPANIPGVR